MCPAFAAGQPLNPKKLIQDMVIGLAGGNDAKFAGSPYPGKPLGEHGGSPHQPIVALDGKAWSTPTPCGPAPPAGPASRSAPMMTSTSTPSSTCAAT